MKNPASLQASSGSKQYSFLPEPELNLIFPTAQTLPGRALARMLKGERLTQPKFGLNCWRLAAYIKELEYLNWPIEKVDVPCPTGFGSGRPIREYWLSSATIQKAQSLMPPNYRSRYARFEQDKRLWFQDNPSATPAEREAAIHKIAQKCGV